MRYILVNEATLTPIYGTFKKIEEKVNSYLSYVGESVYQATQLSEAKWRIHRKQSIGSYTYTDYALEGRFEAIWNSRSNYFNLNAFDNSRSVLFDGVNDYINYNNIFNYNPAQQFSVSFWVKPNNMSAIRSFFGKVTTDANVYGLSLRHEVTGALTLQARALGSLQSYTTIGTISNSSWSHITLTYSGNSNLNGFRVYINGAVQNIPVSAGFSNSWLSGTQDFIIGARSSGIQNYSGNIDEFSVWNKQLSSAEVTSIYNGGSPSDLQTFSFAGDLYNYWKLGDSSDNFPYVFDSQSTSEDGICMNMDSNTAFSIEVP